jgi:hypothetical protein
MKNTDFLAVALCGFCQERFGGKCGLHIKGRKNQRATSNVIINYQTEPQCEEGGGNSFLRNVVVTRTTRCHIPEIAFSMYLRFNTLFIFKFFTKSVAS